MLMSLINRRRQKGIGLLELMLSLAIIAILLIMATRYYQSASDQNKRNQAVDMFAAVNGAVQAYKIDNAADIAKVTIKVLTDNGYLPPSYGSGTGANPWGGTISILPPSGGTFKVRMQGVSTDSCTAVGDRVNSTIATDDGTAAASCSGTNQVTATYNL